MHKHALIVLVSILSMACGGAQRVPRFAPVQGTHETSAVLDTLHRAASEADGEAYFSLFTDDAVFLGTDAKERWTIAEFKEYAMARFNKGTGWTYSVTRRAVDVSDDDRIAFFDEDLRADHMGATRGTGLLVKDEHGRWRIAQYNLTFTVPNDRVEDVRNLLSVQE